MNIFSEVAQYYDECIVRGRFDHEAVVEIIAPFVSYAMLAISDLGAGTGEMAAAAHKKWPQSLIHCEEPSEYMLSLLRVKFPDFSTLNCALQETHIKDQDLVMIAFNSINYVPPEDLLEVFTRIRAGMGVGRVLYFDALTTESAAGLLHGEAELVRTRVRGSLEIFTKLTSTQLINEFTMDTGNSELHVQYLVSDQIYRSLLEYCNFRVEKVESMDGSLRTMYVCRSI